LPRRRSKPIYQVGPGDIRGEAVYLGWRKGVIQKALQLKGADLR